VQNHRKARSAALWQKDKGVQPDTIAHRHHRLKASRTVDRAHHRLRLTSRYIGFLLTPAWLDCQPEDVVKDPAVLERHLAALRRAEVS
jgi:hypothetical protein